MTLGVGHSRIAKINLFNFFVISGRENPKKFSPGGAIVRAIGMVCMIQAMLLTSLGRAV